MTLNLDKSDWKRVAFGDVVRNANEAVRDLDAAGIDRVIAMEHLQSGELHISRWGSAEDGTTFTRRVKPGQTLFGKRRAYQRKVAYARFDAVCSGDIYTFEADETRMLGQILPFVVQSEEFFDHALGTSAGSLSPRTNWRELAKFEFDLPPLDEQNRIADLLWAIERHRVALVRGKAALSDVLGKLSATLLSALPSRTVLSDHVTTRSGPSFAASDVSSAPVDGAVPVIGIPNTKPDGSMDLANVGYVSGLPASVGTIDDSSLVLIRTNGNRQRIGNVYMPPREAHGHAVSAFQFLMRVAESANREFIYWVLRDPAMQARMSDAASGTTGLGNLAVKWLNALEVPWSDEPGVRAAVVERLKGVDEAAQQVAAESTSLETLRASLLEAIFGGLDVAVS